MWRNVRFCKQSAPSVAAVARCRPQHNKILAAERPAVDFRSYGSRRCCTFVVSCCIQAFRAPGAEVQGRKHQRVLSREVWLERITKGAKGRVASKSNRGCKPFGQHLGHAIIGPREATETARRAHSNVDSEFAGSCGNHVCCEKRRSAGAEVGGICVRTAQVRCCSSPTRRCVANAQVAADSGSAGGVASRVLAD